MSAWIRMITDDEATGKVKEALDNARTPHGTVDNVLRVHGLRPHTMHGHITLYRSVLHHEDNTIDLWLLETAGTYTSMLNNCAYSVTHHSLNLKKLLADDEWSDAVLGALEARQPERVFEGRELAMLRYVEKLTLHVGDMCREDFDALIEAGWQEAEVLELNQVVGYFCYVNRLLNGLGVTTEGDVIGFY